jgi:adenylosuccinate lyase
LKPIVLPTVGDQGNLDAVDPLDGRYYDAQIAQHLSERTRVTYQAYLEAALAHTLADFGVCSQEAASQIEAASTKVTIEEVYAEEQTTKHDVKALVNCIKKQIPETAQPYVHFGATSYDIVSSASALQLRGAMQGLILPRLKTLVDTLADLAEKYADTVQIGRSHGQHGVPITFGFAIAEYVSRLGESSQRIEELASQLRGKFSGAMGAYNALSLFVDDPIKFEKSILAKVGLEPAAYSTQIVPAENVVRLLDELTACSGIMANLSHDMRHLQRTEITETRERFEPGQTGSSTMAHKRNPWNFENVVSMNKQVVGQIVNAQLNLASEHQRDLTDSASARFYGITVACVASMAARLNRIMSKIEVDEEAMKRNLKMTGGAIAAEPLYLLFEKYGHTTAHEKAKNLAHDALAKNLPLSEIVGKDPEAAVYWQKFTETERAIIQNPELHYTGLATQKARAVVAAWRKREL